MVEMDVLTFSPSGRRTRRARVEGALLGEFRLLLVAQCCSEYAAPPPHPTLRATFSPRGEGKTAANAGDIR
ncbi:hypothetical protein GGE67_002111 [Rhizobium leucaenae]|nr:hypothetical protein [Rhizobium leucaenae]